MKQHLFCIKGLFFFLLINVQVVYAQLRIDHIDTTELIVAGRDEKQRVAVFRQAITNIAVKISGDKKIGYNSAFKAILTDPESLIAQYHFESGLGADANTAIEKMVVKVDLVALTQKMKDSQLPIWSMVRPLVIFWCVEADKTKEGIRPVILQDSESHPLKEAILRAASFRGLPVVFPLMDLEENNRMSADLLLNIGVGGEDILKEASKRYAADIIVVGSVSSLPEQGQRFRWRVIDRNEKFGEFQIQSVQDLTLLAQNVIDHVTDPLVASYAAILNSGIESTVLFEVKGVSHFYDFFSINENLSSFSLVKSSKLQRVTENSVFYSLILQGELADFKRQVETSGRFLPIEVRVENQVEAKLSIGEPAGTLTGAPESTALIYEWNKRHN